MADLGLDQGVSSVKKCARIFRAMPTFDQKMACNYSWSSVVPECCQSTSILTKVLIIILWMNDYNNSHSKSAQPIAALYEDFTSTYNIYLKG